MPLNEDLILKGTSESDRTYVYRLNFLTDTFGDEHAVLDDSYDEWATYYVADWEAENGGFIAWVGNTPVGGVWLLWGTDDRHGFGYVSADIPELAIAVEGRYSGQGIGTALLDAATELARELGAPAISLAVDPRNARAKQLYLKAGFTPTGEQRYGHKILLRSTNS
ncbi:GNAT family N-acetyltransferase [Arcanobacterium buesumense]|uniref:GNAT family N-acetyltransferase n=1 Tax=Arcanobacterium buesumense TaxID=2722751 RepID=A0A6H2EM17_9ACTO|nr:GNAT family N-acetyltransferase [Arcanobacterium buesumense]QJC22111.1 GNAT family N-acetyltransferase [Arcanobacterium buesumense]